MLFHSRFWDDIFEPWKTDTNDRRCETAVAHWPVNVARKEDEVVVSVFAPGLSVDKIDVSLKGRTVRLAFERSKPELAEASWQRAERVFGESQRLVELPFEADAARVEATYRDGVLTVRLPRAESDKPRRIAVQAAE